MIIHHFTPVSRADSLYTCMHVSLVEREHFQFWHLVPRMLLTRIGHVSICNQCIQTLSSGTVMMIALIWSNHGRLHGSSPGAVCVGLPCLTKWGGGKESKIRADKIEQICMQAKTEMKRKAIIWMIIWCKSFSQEKKYIYISFVLFRKKESKILWHDFDWIESPRECNSLPRSYFTKETARKVGKDPGGGSKKRKEVGNESPLTSMFLKQQAANELNKAREAYNAILEKGKILW
jgi:hypothetical protein